jgi:hypothetical protein
MSKLTKILILFFMSSCALSGRSNDDGVYKYITGATKVDELRNVHVVHIVRAIGVPSNNIVIGKYKYYQWDYARMMGVNTILGGGSTTFYCKLSAETQNNKIKTLNWYGNQCDIFLDQIKGYFQDKFNLTITVEEDSKVSNLVAAVTPEEKKAPEVEKVAEPQKSGDEFKKDLESISPTKSDPGLLSGD